MVSPFLSRFISVLLPVSSISHVPVQYSTSLKVTCILFNVSVLLLFTTCTDLHIMLKL